MPNNSVPQLPKGDDWKKYLETLSKASAVLNEISYSDAKRIAREIAEFLLTSEMKFSEVEYRLRANEPWEYIRGWAEFKDLRFKVTPDVLIPRIETEQLVEAVCAKAKKLLNEESSLNIIDIGTGSGAIIIAVAAELSKTNASINYYATEVSEAALEIAKLNASTLLPNVKFEFNEDNLVEKTRNKLNFNHKTIIAANLPYIPSGAIETLDESVKDFEPHVALDGGKDGAKLYNELLDQLGQRVNEILMYWELDPSVTDAVESALVAHGVSNYSFIDDVFARKRFVSINF